MIEETSAKSYEERWETYSLLMDAFSSFDHKELMEFAMNHPDVNSALFDAIGTVLAEHVDRGHFDHVDDESGATEAAKKFADDVANAWK